MEHISNIIGKLTPEEATWLCDTCGTVLPYYSERTERYLPSMCACQKAAKAEYDARACLAKRTEQRAYTYDWLGNFSLDEDEITILASRTFATFEEYRQPQAAYSTQEFAQVLTGNLVLYGSFGTGKSHLLAALCQELNSRNIRCRYTTAPNLFAAIDWHRSHELDSSEMIRRAIKTPLLIIDDVDKVPFSESRGGIYFRILDSRSVMKRPTAISTNRISELSSFIGEACVSRLSTRLVAEEMIGPDYRREL